MSHQHLRDQTVEYLLDEHGCLAKATHEAIVRARASTNDNTTVKKSTQGSLKLHPSPPHLSLSSFPFTIPLTPPHDAVRDAVRVTAITDGRYTLKQLQQTYLAHVRSR